jgi:hypothetical protein
MMLLQWRVLYSGVHGWLERGRMTVDVDGIDELVYLLLDAYGTRRSKKKKGSCEREVTIGKPREILGSL